MNDEIIAHECKLLKEYIGLELILPKLTIYNYTLSEDTELYDGSYNQFCETSEAIIKNQLLDLPVVNLYVGPKPIESYKKRLEVILSLVDKEISQTHNHVISQLQKEQLHSNMCFLFRPLSYDMIRLICDLISISFWSSEFSATRALNMNLIKSPRCIVMYNDVQSLNTTYKFSKLSNSDVKSLNCPSYDTIGQIVYDYSLRLNTLELTTNNPMNVKFIVENREKHNTLRLRYEDENCLIWPENTNLNYKKSPRLSKSVHHVISAITQKLK